MKGPGLLQLFLALIPTLFAACSGDSLTPTPASSAPAGAASSTSEPATAMTCVAPAAPTEAQTEGPYYKEGSPERTSLVEAGTEGERLVVTGRVLNTRCEPIAGAWLDFWQADANGEYDNAGYQLRGHQSTDANGVYRLETVVPGIYPGRTEHIHVKVRTPSGALLTSQLYFPGTAENEEDSIFSPSLLLTVTGPADSLTGTYDFVVED